MNINELIVKIKKKLKKNINIENILDVKVMRTVVGGKEVYTKYKTGE